MAQRYLIVSQGDRPETAEPLIATADARMISAALAGLFAAMEQPAQPIATPIKTTTAV